MIAGNGNSFSKLFKSTKLTTTNYLRNHHILFPILLFQRAIEMQIIRIQSKSCAGDTVGSCVWVGPSALHNQSRPSEYVLWTSPQISYTTYTHISANVQYVEQFSLVHYCVGSTHMTCSPTPLMCRILACIYVCENIPDCS